MSKKHCVSANAVSLFMAAVLLFTGAAVSSANASGMRDITTQKLVEDMGLGINLGNTFDACVSEEARGVMCTGAEGQVCDWITTWLPDPANPSAGDFERAWGSPIITRDMIKGYANAGFKTVRVPVAWSNGMQRDGNYNIMPGLMTRVQEVVDWILDEDMYVILNIHWDGGWWDNFPTDSVGSMRRFLRIWEQVGDHFKDYSDFLMFASLNEEGGWSAIWNSDEWNSGAPNWRGNEEAKARSFGILNAINQAFVDEIRSQGGNNARRHLQVQGYNTNIDLTCDPLFQMPTDTENRLAVSVHYYDPFAFTHITEPVNWGEWIHPMTTWGTPADYLELNNYLDKMKVNFVDKGIPVIIGEYGVASWDATFLRERESVRMYTLAVTKAMLDRGMLPVLWDVQLDASDGEIIYYYDRHIANFVDVGMLNGFRELAGLEPVSIAGRSITARPATTRPSVAVRGRTLNVSSSTDTDFQVRMIDVRGRIRANFNISGGNGSYSLGNLPSGRYFVEVRGAVTGVKSVSAIVVR
ncbi:MAG: glycoside hydrolase family 5 protein [Chitinispirillales bacterium]|jgi:endoglucanase|nr:glycoside hydrolase family 5 protein [Chitinispirillales bacterium]